MFSVIVSRQKLLEKIEHSLVSEELARASCEDRRTRYKEHDAIAWHALERRKYREQHGFEHRSSIHDDYLVKQLQCYVAFFTI
jgi:hypothetical protein